MTATTVTDVAVFDGTDLLEDGELAQAEPETLRATIVHTPAGYARTLRSIQPNPPRNTLGPLRTAPANAIRKPPTRRPCAASQARGGRVTQSTTTHERRTPHHEAPTQARPQQPYPATPRAAARPAARPEKRQPPRKVPSREL